MLNTKTIRSGQPKAPTNVRNNMTSGSRSEKLSPSKRAAITTSNAWTRGARERRIGRHSLCWQHVVFQEGQPNQRGQLIVVLELIDAQTRR